MKKIATVISVLLLYLSSTAQITITFDDLLGVGDSVELAAVDTVPPGFNPGPSGPDQSWDFSSLEMDNSYFLGFIDPASTPYAASFPSSNIASEGLIEGFGAEGYAYATKNLSVFQIDGFAGSYDVFEDIVVPFEPAEVMFDFPVNYLDSMEQTSVLQVKIESTEPGIDSIWLKLVTTVETKVDAWGEVTTPAWTGEVLRIKDYRVSIDTVRIKVLNFWLFLESSTNISQTYKYMTNDLGYPVLQFNADETGTEFTMVNYLLDVNTGLQEIEKGATAFTIYPNPAKDKLYCSREDGSFEGEIMIIDITGRVLNLLNFNKGSKLQTIDISAYPSGLYQALLKRENGRISYKKFVVL